MRNETEITSTMRQKKLVILSSLTILDEYVVVGLPITNNFEYAYWLSIALQPEME